MPNELEAGKYTFVFSEQPITQRVKFMVRVTSLRNSARYIHILTDFPLETPEPMPDSACYNAAKLADCVLRSTTAQRSV